MKKKETKSAEGHWALAAHTKACALQSKAVGSKGVSITEACAVARRAQERGVRIE
jgi:hypothetical protein